jgi:hypothetical protein
MPGPKRRPAQTAAAATANADTPQQRRRECSGEGDVVHDTAAMTKGMSRRE